MTTTAQQTTPTPAAPNPCTAVLYVCVERGKLRAGLGAERAREEGAGYAAAHGLRITEVIQDPYGEAEPCNRSGWRRVRELAAAAEIGTVIVRWPASIAPDSSADLRHREVAWLEERGVRVRFSWAPLANQNGD